jgi:hypothetical protein
MILPGGGLPRHIMARGIGPKDAYDDDDDSEVCVRRSKV